MSKGFKQYMVFGYTLHCPNGGLDDVLGSFDTVGEADEFAIKTEDHVTDIWDRLESSIDTPSPDMA